jgi:hypothetical protein
MPWNRNNISGVGYKCNFFYNCSINSIKASFLLNKGKQHGKNILWISHINTVLEVKTSVINMIWSLASEKLWPNGSERDLWRLL